MGAAKQLELLRAGRQAPDFELQQLKNGNVRLHKLLSGGPVLLAFFKTACPVCQMTLPFLERIHRQKANSPAIYGISQDDPETTVAFNSEFGVSFPVLLDTEDSGYPVSNAYGLSHVPSLLLVDTDGTVAWRMEGFIKQEFLALAQRAGVDPFRPGEDVPEWKAG
jgi:peroxiredoxin